MHVPGMTMPVRVVVIGVGGHLAHRHHAAMRHRASLTLKLNRRVVDVKALLG